MYFDSNIKKQIKRMEMKIVNGKTPGQVDELSGS
jgi:hypothetical protein